MASRADRAAQRFVGFLARCPFIAMIGKRSYEATAQNEQSVYLDGNVCFGQRFEYQAFSGLLADAQTCSLAEALPSAHRLGHDQPARFVHRNNLFHMAKVPSVI